ncbi:MAG: serpin family protein [Acidobacteria bacterium]|nr:serpin family protein [Acidobacteriota bacterium]
MQNKMTLAPVATLCGLSLAAYLMFQLSGEVKSTRQVTAVVSQPGGETTIKSGIAQASNAFGFDLFQQLQREAANKNVFFSPLSVSLALAMTYNGAAGETQKAMAHTLKLGGMNLDELDRTSAELLTSLKSSDPKIDLAIANSLWARSGMRFKEDFLARNRQFFGAEVSTLDFNNPQSVATINRWVDTNTKGKINKIVDQIDPNQVMFLINAVYFKGQWQKQFEKKLTQTRPFHLLGGQQKQVPMMAQSGNYLYYRGDKFQAVSLPYGKGGVSLYLFLPDQGSSLDGLLKSLSIQKWDEWMNSFNDTPGDVKLPRFKLDYESTLNNALKALGMGVAFNANVADFSGMRPERDLFITEVKHKAIAEINEEGTEASAATSVGIGVTSIRPTPQRFTFIVDRPFLMAIRDSQTGAILFIGAVMEPK